MFKIEAPYPGYQTTIILPSPAWGNSVAAATSMASVRAMDGTLYTYVKQKAGRRRFQFSFEIARAKAFELRAFIKAYYRVPTQFTDHDDNKWIAYLQSNPFEFAGNTRARAFPGGETMTITLEFEEYIQ
jgi:hypothetical protein